MKIEVIVTLAIGVVSLVLYLMRAQRFLDIGRKYRQLSPEAQQGIDEFDPVWKSHYGRQIEGWRKVALVIASVLGLAAFAWARVNGLL